MTYSADQKTAFVMLRAQGKSFEAIAQELGISKPTLLKWQSELFDAIKEQEFYEVQRITELYQVTRRDRLDAIAKLLGAVRTELARRADAEQLADLPTDKLTALALVLEKRLMQDTGRELVSVRVDATDRLLKSMDEVYIDAD
jgi:transposase-like protein